MASRTASSDGILARIGRAITEVFNRPVARAPSDRSRVGVSQSERAEIHDRYNDVARQVEGISRPKTVPGLPFYVAYSREAPPVACPANVPPDLLKSLHSLDYLCGRGIDEAKSWASSTGSKHTPLRMKDCDDGWRVKSMNYKGINPSKWMNTPAEYQGQEMTLRWYLEQRYGLKDMGELTPKTIEAALFALQQEARRSEALLNARFSPQQVWNSLSSALKSGVAGPKV